MPKTSGNLELAIARRQADDYDALVMQQSREACDCHDCESTMKLGIQVFDWIISADRTYRKNLFAGSHPYDAEMEAALAELLRRWHRQCDQVIQWANHHVGLGFDVANLSDFKNRREEASAMIKSLDDGDHDRIMSEPLILLRDQALEEHRNGQTAEFV
jgi:hypothetical protein